MEDTLFHGLRNSGTIKGKRDNDKIVQEIYNYNKNLNETYRKSIYSALNAGDKTNENLAQIVRDYTWLEKDRIILEMLK